VSCSRCGLSREITDYDSGFAAFYSTEAGNYEIMSDELFAQKSQGMARYTDYLGRFIQTKGIALDVGCNSGYLLDQLKKKGWQVSGMDLCLPLVKCARDRGFSVSAETLETTSMPANSTDLLTMLHVLEHIPQPQRALSRALEILKPGGYLFVAVPNIESRLFQRVYGDASIFLPVQHIWYFSKKTLRSTVEKFGFKFVNAQTYLNLSDDSRRPFGKLVKSLLNNWIRYNDSGDEIFALFQKPVS